MNSVIIKDLKIQYENHLVLNNFSKNFGTGVHWIQGQNGTGKSSLLKSLCGIYPVNSGVVKIMGHDLVDDTIKAKSELCFVADKPDVYPFMTGLQYLSFLAKVKNVELTQALFSWLEAVNLNKYLDVEFSHMSFGTRRKFSLSSVFIGNPKVILLDEPFNGLDKHTLEMFSQWLMSAREDECLLIVSHEPHIISDIYDSVTLLGGHNQ